MNTPFLPTSTSGWRVTGFRFGEAGVAAGLAGGAVLAVEDATVE